ncbi:MAG TPA: hypothetical protein VIG66_06110, partial [Noviherbaspirillum sp.]
PIILAKRKANEKLFHAQMRIYYMLPVSENQLVPVQDAHVKQYMDIVREVSKEHFKARLSGNNDFVNFEFANTGPTSTGKMAVVDGGNGLTRGFGGKERTPDNAETANDRPKPSNPWAPNPILPYEHVFSGDVGRTRTNVGGTPRSVPPAALVRNQIRAENRLAEAGDPLIHMSRVESYERAAFAGQMEAAYEMALVPDEAFQRLCARRLDPSCDWDALYEENEDRSTPPDEKLARVLIERRDALVAQFSPKELAQWEAEHPEKAKQSYNRVAASLADEVGIYIPPRFAPEPSEYSAQKLGPQRRNSFAL